MSSNEDRFSPKQYSASDDQEDEGNLIVANLLNENKRVKLRVGGNDKTPGRDGLIELRDTEKAIGIGKLELQLKPVDRPRKD